LEWATTKSFQLVDQKKTDGTCSEYRDVIAGLELADPQRMERYAGRLDNRRLVERKGIGYFYYRIFGDTGVFGESAVGLVVSVEHDILAQV
jgi:hypothetical protein